MSLQCGRWRPPGEYVVPDGMEDVLPRKTWLMHLLSRHGPCAVCWTSSVSPIATTCTAGLTSAAW